MKAQNVGHILWSDLTVSNAEDVKEFYEAVVGWTSSDVEMGGYCDFMMASSDQRPQPSQEQARIVAGICHARGSNAGLPAQWLNYFGVADLDVSRAKVQELGGKLIGEIRTYGKSRYCVIEDPAGAVCGLFENVSDDETTTEA